VLILSALIGARFGWKQLLSLHGSLVFEQSYGGVEGDSASLVEACALLSAIALDAQLRELARHGQEFAREALLAPAKTTKQPGAPS
jgi:hypothetical protein